MPLYAVNPFVASLVRDWAFLETRPKSSDIGYMEFAMKNDG
jgi:hypothetical protein